MRTDIVKKHVRLWASQPFEWLSHNCALAVLAYVEDVTGQSYPHDFTAVDGVGAHDWLERQGGLIRLARSFAEHFGMIEVRSVVAGDIGVFRAGDTAICGLCVGDDRWAYVTENGVAISPASHLAAWRIV